MYNITLVIKFYKVKSAFVSYKGFYTPCMQDLEH